MKYHHLAGFTLAEILVSLMLFSILLLGMDAMGLFALQQEKNAWILSLATNQLSNMAERLIALGNYEGLSQQTALWNQENQMVLPSGAGTVTGKFPNYKIALDWRAETLSHLDEDISI